MERVVQLNEAYFGGSKNSRALFMGKQVGSRKLRYQILPHTNPTRENAWWFLKNHVAPNSRLNTDGASIYKQIDQW